MGVISGAVLTSVGNDIAKRTIASVFELLAKKYQLMDILKFKEHYLDYCEKNLEIKTLVSQDKSFNIDEIYIRLC